MKVESRQGEYWALSKKFDKYRLFLGGFCWPLPDRPNTIFARIAVFQTRKEARNARKICCYPTARVEKVRITIEAI